MDLERESSTQTEVVGCIFSVTDLCFVRLETALISVAFDSTEEVILYTRPIKTCGFSFKEGTSAAEEIKTDKALLRALLGPLFEEANFGIHKLRGGPFEVIVPEKGKLFPIPKTELHQVFEDVTLSAEANLLLRNPHHLPD